MKLNITQSPHVELVQDKTNPELMYLVVTLPAPTLFNAVCVIGLKALGWNQK